MSSGSLSPDTRNKMAELSATSSSSNDTYSPHVTSSKSASMSEHTEATKPLTKFHLFPKLAPELRAMIWSSAIGKPCSLHQFYIQSDQSVLEKTICVFRPTTSHPSHSIGRTCHVSREQTLALFPYCLHGKGDKVWRFGKLDTICILNGLVFNSLYTQIRDKYMSKTKLGVPRSWSWADNVRRLMLASHLLNLWNIVSGSVVLKEFHNLEELHFVMSYYRTYTLPTFSQQDLRKVVEWDTSRAMFFVDVAVVEACIAESGGNKNECIKAVNGVIKEICRALPESFKVLPINIFALKGWTRELKKYG
ncbi:uncharacterized protein PAC_11620 [Phialocephala subalpina]|uniref:2EXR domain-containing protein n=1 Tax=Phialocephala subalpina TaxID=576137 RepID=A0A1L7X9L8_9HELO|nr:uncharacterized protein PAC_11620 [Phialocephala subalpina]